MKLSDVQQYWDRQAHADPMWAILTDPAKAGGRWDEDEFFATGVHEVGIFMEQAAAWGAPAARRSYRMFRPLPNPDTLASMSTCGGASLPLP